MMRRHLLALFALFSGFAALSAPAHASALDSMVFDAGAFSSANDTPTGDQCICTAQNQQAKKRCPKRERKLTPRRLLEALGLPVVIGSDRSLE